MKRQQTHSVNGMPAVELKEYPDIYVLDNGDVSSGISLSGREVFPAKTDKAALVTITERQMADAKALADWHAQLFD